MNHVWSIGSSQKNFIAWIELPWKLRVHYWPCISYDSLFLIGPSRAIKESLILMPKPNKAITLTSLSREEPICKPKLFHCSQIHSHFTRVVVRWGGHFQTRTCPLSSIQQATPRFSTLWRIFIQWKNFEHFVQFPTLHSWK